jgi:four helix bundle protein
MTEEDKRRPIRSFEDLDVYQRAYGLALDVHKASLRFPEIERFGLAEQMRRASRSICANLAEGFARQRQSSPEFKRFLSMSIGSSDEMKVWLMFSRDLGYLDAGEVERLREAYTIVAKMLTGLADRWR